MKPYVKPMIIPNEELAEGVYASSGSSADCWSVEAVSSQYWDGAYHVFEVHMEHDIHAGHVSTAQTITLSFSGDITAIRCDFPCTFSGNTVTITREVWEDIFLSGTNVTFNLWVQAADQAATEQLYCTGATITCTSQTNDQGGYD